ncbi:hypothetical protein GPECTOR_6g602 [Gonium pectorale]|uniref:CN hydrolase domain-containing protein n=1 Tax=Gonium pectorale TaxID=33097 RepID=A0A150GUZ5_GONPE|nr:hypothetical protein GPECTOR_6g602 [Gonium pectorale]|eukprot:KXZ53685.1 hypothetical protein GPECTOR_6g602 [Gonium pectorale]
MVEQEVFGTVLRFVQDPSSEHLGTTNIRKGDFARSKVRGKRAIELGAGMGLAGMAFAMVGADVVLTDTADVLGLLRINYDNNMSPAAVRLAKGHAHGTWADSAGSCQVAELDWTRPEQVHAPPLRPPYDYVLAADCIYHETLTEHFHRTVMDVTNDKSTVVVCNELRSHSVQGRFMELFTATHTIKSVPHSKMDDTYQHPNIFIYIMKKKKKMGAGAAGGKGGDEDEGEGAAEELTAAAPAEEAEVEEAAAAARQGAGPGESGTGQEEAAAAQVGGRTGNVSESGFMPDWRLADGWRDGAQSGQPEAGRSVVVATTQFHCTHNREANIARAEELVRQAAAAGAQIILLQELFEGPYWCQVQTQEYYDWAAPLEGNALVERFSRLAAELKVVLPVPFFERANNVYFNSCAVVDADGAVLGVYRKSHIPDGPGNR